MKSPYGKTTTNTTTNHIMNNNSCIFPPTNWDQQKEKSLYKKRASHRSKIIDKSKWIDKIQVDAKEKIRKSTLTNFISKKNYGER